MLLGQSDVDLARWRNALREALGANGQLMVNLVPELELVLGTAHGGRLWAADHAPRGASFCLTLPTRVEGQH
jgi:predicted ATPase